VNHFSSDAEIALIARGLIDRSLPKSSWTHAAHFATALWLLKHRGPCAVGEMPALIWSYNEAKGVANTDTSGYHETITIASLRAAHTWLVERPESALHVVLDQLLASALGHSAWLLTYWSKPVLFSATARKTWLEPDLEPLPFGAVIGGSFRTDL
jgi:hypothetical protein